MKRIIAVSTLAVATLVGFSSAASAQTADSTHTGTIAATCSVTSDAPKTFTSVTTPINGVSFPTSLTSTGKFTTLCNTASSGIRVEKSVAATVPTGQTAPAVTYDLTASSPSAYVGNNILSADNTFATVVKTGTVAHGYSVTPSDLGVAVKVAAQSGTILQDGAYSVVLKATLTP